MRVFAPIACLKPEFGRYGPRKLPRAARAFNCWRRWVLSQSRTAFEVGIVEWGSHRALSAVRGPAWFSGVDGARAQDKKACLAVTRPAIMHWVTWLCAGEQTERSKTGVAHCTIAMMDQRQVLAEIRENWTAEREVESTGPCTESLFRRARTSSHENHASWNQLARAATTLVTLTHTHTHQFLGHDENRPSRLSGSENIWNLRPLCDECNGAQPLFCGSVPQ